ncbi:cyclin-dependent protein kinase inhibitor SMR6 [Humulus lupulus]|uniref:cyclin-dependent protein kinase inhibitor SMR6 n=1 Tax=Humulus lupulus TaxID=3486 RepID=UPI002B4065CC|nr:cyclin-dependent protein kinase inhibitor SMR6 [Humulus lupulus]
MGFSKKSQIDGGFESEGKKWVIAGISVRSSLKPIKTKTLKAKDCESDNGDDYDSESCSTTPTSKESRIPERLRCPPAPRKRRPSSRCNFNGVKEFFAVPDLETVFIRHVEKAN